MKALSILFLGAFLCGCASAPTPYAGSHGSTYDKAREPPYPVAPSTYDPRAPIVPMDFGNGGESRTPLPVR